MVVTTAREPSTVSTMLIFLSVPVTKSGEIYKSFQVAVLFLCSLFAGLCFVFHFRAAFHCHFCIQECLTEINMNFKYIRINFVILKLSSARSYNFGVLIDF